MRAWNYEVGEKARFFDNWLTVNSDVYYIKWLGVQQVITLPCGYQYYNNAGDGRSFGPELEIDAKLADDWSASLSGAWTHAKLTHPNASYTSFLENVAHQPGWRDASLHGGHQCAVPIMNVVKDTASLTLNLFHHRDERLSSSRPTPTDSFVGSSYDVAYYFGYKLPSYRPRQCARRASAHGNWSADLFVRQPHQQGRVDFGATTPASSSIFLRWCAIPRTSRAPPGFS